MKKLGRKVAVVMGILSNLLLTGCTNVNMDSNVYQRISSETKIFTNGLDETKAMGFDALEAYIKVFCHNSLPVGILIVIVSWIIGFIMLRTVGDDIGMRKKAINSFILGIPGCILLCVIMVNYLAGVFFS